MRKTQQEQFFIVKKDIPFKLTFQRAIKKLERVGIIKLRAIGTTIQKAISLSEKLVDQKYAIYLRFTTDQVVNVKTKQIKVAVQIQLKYKNSQRQDQKQPKKYMQKTVEKNQKVQGKTKVNNDKGGRNNESNQRDRDSGIKRQGRSRNNRN